MPDKLQIIGVDLGGTKIGAGRIIESGAEAEVAKHHEALLGKEHLDDADAVLNIVIDTITGIFSKDVKGIGIGVPSVVDRHKGIIYDVVNIPSWKEVPLKSILESKFNVPVFIDNDVNCFTLGTRMYGIGRKYENFVGIALGTGIGGGIINNGKLLTDANCGSGEFGEILYKDKRYEDYCSGMFFREKYNTDGKELAEKAKAGDKSALKIFEEFGYHLGNAIKTIMFAVDPEAVIIGGSIAASKDLFEEAMWKQIKTFTFHRSAEKLKIEFSKKTKYTPILGAAAVCLQHLKE
ncbi:ROK family protein [Candidatus Auribacterota bacterium]